MIHMSDLKHENRITARTSPVILEGVNTLLARLKSAGYEFRGRKIGIEGLVGCVLLEFLGKSQEEQFTLIGARLPELEQLTGYAGEAGRGASGDDIPDLGSRVAMPEAAPKKQPKRRSG